jgi:hypothetical protein
MRGRFTRRLVSDGRVGHASEPRHRRLGSRVVALRGELGAPSEQRSSQRYRFFAGKMHLREETGGSPAADEEREQLRRKDAKEHRERVDGRVRRVGSVTAEERVPESERGRVGHAARDQGQSGAVRATRGGVHFERRPSVLRPSGSFARGSSGRDLRAPRSTTLPSRTTRTSSSLSSHTESHRGGEPATGGAAVRLSVGASSSIRFAMQSG